MRIAELTGLKWSDIDLEGGWITLTDETGYQAGAEPRRALKSGRSRSVPIDIKLRGVLERLPRKDSHVFLEPTQRALKPDYVRRKFVKYVIEPLAAKFPRTPGKRASPMVGCTVFDMRSYRVARHKTSRNSSSWNGSTTPTVPWSGITFLFPTRRPSGKCAASISSATPAGVPTAKFRSPNRGGDAQSAR